MLSLLERLWLDNRLFANFFEFIDSFMVAFFFFDLFTELFFEEISSIYFIFYILFKFNLLLKIKRD